MTETATKEDRIDRGLALWRERRAEIRPVSGRRWSVPGSGGRSYIVSLETGVCECRDHVFNCFQDERCKHFWAAALEAAAPAPPGLM